ncbi:MYXO-CTERM domain-containing protein [Haladaptatus litoreus]|uniref:MYXO-CTERM domain-containing protein n=2 Tax=Haladaptatus litoreus TaxID=553468 RepID=A0A1N7BBX8_9EURY|nr:MYXO-CTERM domain-containing protein [Haladaptatus litoreus]
MAAAGATLVVGTSAAQSTNGKVVFTYDDGPIEDYTHAYQRAHREERVPGCVAVPSAGVGTDGSLSAAQLRELEADGWEIMSHSVYHRALGAMAVTEDVVPDDRKLYVESNLHGKIEGDRLVVNDGSQSATVTVRGRGSDERGEFVTLDSEVGTSFAADDGVTERYVDEVIRTSLRESRTQLEEYGVTVTNMVMPYGAYGPRTRELAGEYYTAVANGGLAIGGRGQLHRAEDITLPHLSRAMFRKGKMTETELGEYLDGVAGNNALGILGGHSWHERLPPSRIKTAIRMAKERGIDIVTLRDALSSFDLTGNGTTQTTQTTGTRSAGTGTTDDGLEAGQQGTTSQSSETTAETGQPGFGWLATVAGVGGAAALRRRLGE